MATKKRPAPLPSHMEVLITQKNPVSDGMWLVGETSSLVAGALVIAQAEQKIPICILNLGKRDMTLQGGSRVTMASPMDGPEVIECLPQEPCLAPSIPGELEEDLRNTIKRVGDQLTQEQEEVLLYTTPWLYWLVEMNLADPEGLFEFNVML